MLPADRDFVEDLLPVIEPLMRRRSPPPPRTIFATATVPETLTRFLQQRHPDTVRLITPNLHKLPHNLSVARVAWSGGNWMADVLMEIRRAFVEDARDGNEHSQVLVFVNKTTRAVGLNEYLTEKGFGNLLMTSESKTRKRGTNKHVADFLVNPRDQIQGLIAAKYDPKLHLPVKPPPKAIGNKVELDAPDPVLSEQRVMVTTGVLSRGLDFSPNVSTVLMVDEPTTAVDFIHRAGRAGRAGNMGRVVIFSKSHKASMNALPSRKGLGGAGRGGAIWKTIQAARERFASKRAKKSRISTRGGKQGHGTFNRR
jgi:ATP-dependent RNA helicase MRH4